MDTLAYPALGTVLTDSIALVKTETIQTSGDQSYLYNCIWLLFCTALIFLMNLGFACIESGLIRAKNATNVLFKNILIPVLAILIFSGWGFQLMFPGKGFEDQFAGFGGFGIQQNQDITHGNLSFWIFFLHHAMLATVATAIISGAVAERIKFTSFIIFSIIFIGVIYPVIGMWYWGGGWLSKFLSVKFYDFAGGSIVHSVGGYAALVGAGMLGPRIGKYIDGKIMPIPGHNMSLASIGLFILWFGWVGFCGGASYSANPDKISLIIITTFIAAGTGCIGALFISFLANRTHDITMSINGILAGLVAISASADIMSFAEAAVIGFIAGLLVVFSVLMFDKMKIDDPIGAISVHLICGIWGTLAIGVFGPLAGKEQFLSQLIGCISIGAFASISSFGVFFLINKTNGLRVSQKDEIDGLDRSAHGMRAYNLDAENN